MESYKIKNYYSLLGVRFNASKDEIKSAYRKLAKVMHPDVNKSPDAKERFQELSEAYEILSNETSRKKYDDILRMYKNKSSTWRDTYSSFRETEQSQARKQAEEYSSMSLDEILEMIKQTLLHGEKESKKNLSIKTYHILGLRVFLCIGLVEMMGTVILTIPAVVLFSIVLRGFYYKEKFVGIMPVVKGFFLIVGEIAFVTFIVIIILAIRYLILFA